MSKRLVAYISASGVTAKVAENLADAIGRAVEGGMMVAVGSQCLYEAVIFQSMK